MNNTEMDACFDRFRRNPQSPEAHAELLCVLRSGFGRERMRQLIRDSDARVVEAVMFALSELGSDTWVAPETASVITHGSVRSAYYAMELVLLTHGEDIACVIAVLELLESPSPVLRQKAMEVLVFLPAGPLRAASSRSSGFGPVARAALGLTGGDLPPHLKEKAEAIFRLRNPIDQAEVKRLLEGNDLDVQALVSDLRNASRLQVQGDTSA